MMHDSVFSLMKRHERFQQYNNALILCQMILDYDDTVAEAHFYKARYLYLTGNSKEALIKLHHAMNHNYWDEEGIEWLRKQIEESPK